MRMARIIAYILVPIVLLSLISCAGPSLSPKDTVKLYLDEMMIFKDPLYKRAALDELKGDSEKAKRYAKAGQTLKELLWTDPSSFRPERRKKLLITLGTIVTFKGYRILSDRVEGDKAYVTVALEETSLFNIDLGAASEKDSKPIPYELIKTRQGWRIRDINGILAKRGF